MPWASSSHTFVSYLIFPSDLVSWSLSNYDDKKLLVNLDFSRAFLSFAFGSLKVEGKLCVCEKTNLERNSNHIHPIVKGIFSCLFVCELSEDQSLFTLCDEIGRKWQGRELVSKRLEKKKSSWLWAITSTWLFQLICTDLFMMHACRQLTCTWQWCGILRDETQYNSKRKHQSLRSNRVKRFSFISSLSFYCTSRKLNSRNNISELIKDDHGSSEFHCDASCVSSSIEVVVAILKSFVHFDPSFGIYKWECSINATVVAEIDWSKCVLEF